MGLLPVAMAHITLQPSDTVARLLLNIETSQCNTICNMMWTWWKSIFFSSCHVNKQRVILSSSPAEWNTSWLHCLFTLHSAVVCPNHFVSLSSEMRYIVSFWSLVLFVIRIKQRMCQRTSILPADTRLTMCSFLFWFLKTAAFTNCSSTS